MTETLFNKRLQVQVKCKNCEERRANIRVSIELQLTTNPVHKRDLLVRLTDDTDSYFLYNLAISEEDFQSLKVQQGLLVDFASFPQKFIDLLNQCISAQDEEYPRFLLQLLSPSSPVLDHSPAHLNVVETNAFKHLTHLSLKLLHGTDIEIKKYPAICLSCVKVSKLKEQLEATVKKLDESREVLKTNENVIIWLNKQLNENQLSRKPETLGTLTTPPALSASAGQRTGGASHMLSMSWYMLDSQAFPPSAGQGYPITSMLNSKLYCLPLSSRSVCSLHNQGPGLKVQFNPMSAKPGVSPVDSSPTAQHPPQPSNKENGVPAGLESKYFEKRDDSIPLHGLLSGMHLNRDVPRPPQAKPGLHSLS